MIEAGILQYPPVDVALAYHVSPGKIPIGIYRYNNSSTMMFTVDSCKILIKGKGYHGAYTHFSINPINIGTKIYNKN